MITKIQLKNFKIHKHTCITLTGGLSILTGENNSGKSSLLEAVLIFQECYHHTLHKIQRKTAKVVKSGALKVGDYSFREVFISRFSSVRSENYLELFHDQTAAFSLHVEFDIAGETLTLAFDVAQGRNQTAYHITPRITDANLVLINRLKPASFLHVIKSSPVATMPRNEVYMPPRLLEKHTAENEHRLTIRNRLLLLKQQHKLVNLQTQMQYVMGFSAFQLQIDFDMNTDLYISVACKTELDGTYQDIAMLGSGTLQILEVLIALNLETGVNEAIVLLDEPDSYLHRRLQNNLIVKLREISGQGHQIVCTTHNEQMIAAASLSELLHLSSPRLGMDVLPMDFQLPSGRCLGGLQSLSKIKVYESLGVSASSMNILEAIESDRVVFVEGRSDAMYIEALQAKRASIFPVAKPLKVSFWSLNGITDLANKLKYWQDILGNIKNGQSIWEKGLLVLDGDFLSLAERAGLHDAILEKHGLETYFWPAYTLESIFLTDIDGFTSSLALWLGVAEQDVLHIVSGEVLKISVAEKTTSIEGQRKTRIHDFSALASSQLKHLNEGNVYANYLTSLKQAPVSYLANKKDVFEILKLVMDQYGDDALKAASSEEQLLLYIESLNANTWQSEWTDVLRAIYG